ncbi:hypothetical protein D1814_15000 [Alteromonas sp. BL110]|uniref:hypothetical protein n=1 Tax=Alteromonas sp. BL110 TaxID=1714845 RepID=UPI000E4D59F3|nr:hypothetical protein [Alteromonas sp. BL110]AXT39891.1 hypothetical protein D1814_15000 [Alteromonas sp. BL110]RKM79120.1 hypothetical protein D7031_08995 [Alteromonas sp. BL110]
MKAFLGKYILHIDGIAGTSVGLLLLFFQDIASDFYQLPKGLILFLAGANVCYGIYALRLAFIRNRSLNEVAALAIANFLWAITCVGFLLTYYEQASIFALLFISAECLFVAILGLSEWCYRFLLVSSGD